MFAIPTRTIFLVLCTLCIRCQAMGQSLNTSTSDFSFSAGATHSRLIDEAFSHNQLKYTGTAFTLGLAYQRRNKDGVVRATLQAQKTTVHAAGNQFKADFANVRLSLAYAPWMREHSLFGFHNVLYLGGSLAASNYFLLDLDVIEDGTVTFNYTINAYVQQVTELNGRNRIRSEIVLPLAGFVKRQRYNGGINKQLETDYLDHPFALLFRDARFRGVNPIFFPQLNIQFLHQLDRTTDLLIRYSFQSLINKDIAPVRMYSNGITAGLAFNF